MEAIKRILQCDVRALNQSIVKTQAVIDKCFNTMLDALPGTDEYLKVKVEHDIKSQEKWIYYGQLGAIEKMLKLLSDKEEIDSLEEDIEAYNYFESVGAEDLPF